MEYYIGNMYSGDNVVFWQIDGHGYTLNIDEAWKVPKEQAEKICSNKDRTDFMLRADLVEKAASRQMSIERYRSFEREENAINKV